ncbi:MAG: prolyl oligopeptidase family serine peptidase [Planctomycetes bacterium]|nr:prolyl oligopeptidase family serine peptidase [Planctomycetota bacterium]
MIEALLLALLVQTPPLGAQLEALVDLATPQERQARALELAASKETSLEDWLAAMRAFGRFEKSEAGAKVEKVPLLCDGKLEETELQLHIPPNYDPARPAPLICAFHGTGGSGREMVELWHALADALGALVLAPSDPGKNDGYGWTQRERDGALEALRWMRRHYDVDEHRIYATGISRGGHLAWDLALRHPDLFAALAPQIGGPRLAIVRGQNNMRLLENLVPLPIRDLQGAQDDEVLVESLHVAFARLAKFGAQDALLKEFPKLGHSFEFDAVDWKSFLGGAVRPSAPEHVVRCSARLGEARSFWIEITGFEKEVSEEFQPIIPVNEWKALDAAGQRARMLKEAEKRTARLEAKFEGPGKFTLVGSGVTSFRLLLSSERLGPQNKLSLKWQGKSRAPQTVVLDKKVALEDFAECFDRSWIPVAEYRGP